MIRATIVTKEILEIFRTNFILFVCVATTATVCLVLLGQCLCTTYRDCPLVVRDFIWAPDERGGEEHLEEEGDLF